VFVVASRSAFEGFPRTIWEAMASRVPVVATSVGSIPEILENGRHGLIVSPRSPEELEDAIARIIADEDLRRKIIDNGYRLAEGNTLEVRATELIDHIEKFVEASEPVG
jgi:glycosyltransferase involved in cell wall biosynthesis